VEQMFLDVMWDMYSFMFKHVIKQSNATL